MYSWNQLRPFSPPAAATSSIAVVPIVDSENGMPWAAAAERAGALALGLHHPGEAGRRDAERQLDALAEHVPAGVDRRDVAQDRRVELDVVERLARAGQD